MSKKVFIKTFGCQINMYDSNRILDIVKKIGFEKTNILEDSNCFILNTCHIREKAAEKVYSDIGRINKIKQKGKKIKKNYKLIIAGCVAQAEGLEIKKRSPNVDYIVGPQSYHQLPDMILSDKKIISDDFLQHEKVKNLLFKSSNKVSEFCL